MAEISRLYWPPFQARLEATLNGCASKGHHYTRALGFRTFAQQNRLYDQGRTTPGPRVTWARGGESCHNYGLAEDVLLYLGPDVVDNREASYRPLAAEGRKNRLQVGVPGRADYGHIQIPALEWFGCSEKELLALLRPVLIHQGLEACWEQLDQLSLKGNIS